MKNILDLNSVNIGGKRLYLGPWIDGSQFKRNSIKIVSTWIKLVDVTHSYWSVEGLGNIAKAVGEPLALDKQTAQLNPIKYAGILVELKYGTSYPKVVWVQVINDEDGSIVKEKVGIQYSAIPYSCKFCKAFGHSDSKCTSNPLFSTTNRSMEDADTGAVGVNKSNVKSDDKSEDMQHNEDCEHPAESCKEIIDDTEGTNNDLGNTVDIVNITKNIISNPTDNMKHPLKKAEGNTVIPREIVYGLKAHQTPRGRGRPPNIVTKLTATLEEGEIVSPTQPTSSKNKKRRKNPKPKAQNGPFADNPPTPPTVSSHVNKGKLIVDEEGFTQVPLKRSLRLQGDATKSPSFLC